MATIRVLGASVLAPIYLYGIRQAKANPARTFKHTLRSYLPGTGEQIVREYRQDLHHRINQRGNAEPPESRTSIQDWGMIRTPCVILERHTIRSLNRHQKPRFTNRQREEY